MGQIEFVTVGDKEKRKPCVLSGATYLKSERNRLRLNQKQTKNATGKLACLWPRVDVNNTPLSHFVIMSPQTEREPYEYISPFHFHNQLTLYFGPRVD